MVNIKRCLVHTFIPPWRWRWLFSKKTLKAIELAVQQSERQHRGELRFAIENNLPTAWVWRGLTARQRATEVFSNLRVWDTEENSGVLIYVLLADKEVHIVADRGIAKFVPQQEWEVVAKTMQTAFHLRDFRGGALEGINRITALLASHFPAGVDKLNELPDQPVIISR